MLQGKSACFPDDESEDIIERLSSMQIHPTGVLWGEGESMASGECLTIEKNIADKNELFCEGLEGARLKQERRSLRLLVQDLNWRLEDKDCLYIDFSLPAGAFATMVLREVVSHKS